MNEQYKVVASIPQFRVKMGDHLATKNENLASILPRTKQQERILDEMMNVVRISLG